MQWGRRVRGTIRIYCALLCLGVGAWTAPISETPSMVRVKAATGSISGTKRTIQDRAAVAGIVPFAMTTEALDTGFTPLAGDHEPDGDVDLVDYAHFALHYGFTGCAGRCNRITVL